MIRLSFFLIALYQKWKKRYYIKTYKIICFRIVIFLFPFYTLNLEELEVDYNKFGYSNEIIEAGFDWLANILKTESVYENEIN